MRHKYYEFIIAWAEGYDIQELLFPSYIWRDEPNPDWLLPNAVFRIKPDQKVTT